MSSKTAAMVTAFAVGVGGVMGASDFESSALEIKNAIRSHYLRSGATTTTTTTTANDCSHLSIFAEIERRGIDGDSELLQSSDYTMDHLCGAVLKWNRRYPDATMFTEGGLNDNLETMAAFLANANHESAEFKACGERVQPCGTQPCSPGFAVDYQDHKWGECFMIPVVTETGFELSDQIKLPQNACGSSPTCYDWAGRKMEGDSCWYGRGALQLTWNCNYAKADILVRELGIESLDICNNPDSVCSSGEGFFATAISYWMSVVHPVYKRSNFEIDTSMHCIKDDNCSVWDVAERGPWNGSGAADRRKWYSEYKDRLEGSFTEPPTFPSGACGTWNDICPTCPGGSGNCKECTSDPTKWQCA